MTNIKGSGASLIGGGAKDSGASLNQPPVFRSTISDLAGGKPNASTFHKKSADMTQTTTKLADDSLIVPSPQLVKNQSVSNL